MCPHSRQSKCYTILDIWPATEAFLQLAKVKAAQERKIGSKQDVLPIIDREQIIRYSLELTERRATALCTSEIHREMRYP